MEIIKPKLWKEVDLTGEWDITFKIDGVRCIVKNGVARSRADKPLYNLPELPDGDYEVFTGNWEDTISSVRTQQGELIDKKHIYSLEPFDERLWFTSCSNPTKEFIKTHLSIALCAKYEGLVLRQANTWLKVKPVETYDVPVVSLQEGTGRNKGRLGAFITPMGKVGTGFTDLQREEYCKIPLGTIIEVECMQLTPQGKFRHPRFVRVREDK